MKKYPRTYHFDFSPEIHSDDKIINEIYLKNFLNTEIIITEKLDGGNCCIKNEGVFARTHSLPTDCETFNYIKNVHYYSKKHLLNKNYMYFGENMFAIHSIEYQKLTDYFYCFKIFDKIKKIWLSYDDFKNECIKCDFQIVPLIFKGYISKIEDIKKICENSLKTPSFFGKEKEGFVISITNSFLEEDFEKNVAKYVRKNHVQSDKHWKQNWKKQDSLKN